MTTKPLTAEGLRGLLAEVAAVAALGIKGRIELELVDDRTGRVIDRRSADNYVNTVQWESWAKAVQKSVFHYGYQGDASTITLRPDNGSDPRSIPGFRNDHIACWADATAENTADLWPFGEVVAWAHRWPQGSPSTRQGLVQPTLCTLTDDAVSWVWEWTTTNGNGTFQSVGWRRLAWSALTGDAILADHLWPAQRLTVASGFSNAISQGGTVTNAIWTVGSTVVMRPLSIYYNAADSSLYSLHPDPSASIWKLVRCPVTFDAYGNYSLGAVVNESANAIAAGLKGNSLTLTTASTFGLTRLGAAGDWIAVGHTGAAGGVGRRPFLARVTPAGVTTYTNANAGTYTVESGMVDVTYDGTNLWVIGYNGNAGIPAIHRVDPATGTISATISAVAGVPTNFPAWVNGSRVPTGIEWDATNAWLWVTDTNGYTYNIDTSGNWLGALLTNATATTATLTGLQTNPGTAPTLGMASTDPVYILWNGAGGANLVTDPHSIIKLGASDVYAWAGIARSRLFNMNGICISAGSDGSWQLANVWNSVRIDSAPNFASRTNLGAPVTKLNTQTMRIRYTMTFT